MKDWVFGRRFMDENGGNSGEGGGGAGETAGGGTGTAGSGAAGSGAGNGEGSGTGSGSGGSAGSGQGGGSDGSDLKDVTLQGGKGGQGEAGKGGQGDQGGEVSEPRLEPEDYVGGIKFDQAIAKDVIVDENAIRAIAPILKELKIRPEDASRLTNELAKYQVQAFKSRQQERYADNKKMHDAALQKYTAADFDVINAGIDAAFDPKGVMNFVIRNSEIGNDPEFLALMRWYGEHKPTNTNPSGVGGAGTVGQSAGYAGIAGAWN